MALKMLTQVALLVIVIGYQWYFKDLLWVSLGLRRKMQVIEDFPYSCRRIRHELLEGCEDIWLDNEARTLYAACSSTLSRTQWSPS